MMSDIENLHLILGKHSKNSHSERHEYKRNEIDTVSAGLQENTKTLVEDFRSPLNSISGGNSEVTAETVGFLMRN